MECASSGAHDFEASNYCSSLPKPDQSQESWRLPTKDEFDRLSSSGLSTQMPSIDWSEIFWSSSQINSKQAGYFFPQSKLLRIYEDAAELASVCVNGASVKSMMMAAGGNSTCAIHDNKITCWGGLKTYKVPDFKNPIQVVIGRFSRACALDEDVIKCWGVNDHDDMGQPDNLYFPKMLSASYTQFCAADRHGIQCWGMKDYAITKHPTFVDPKLLSSGSLENCAIDQYELVCWDKTGLTKVPNLKDPFFIAQGTFEKCAIGAEGLQCWGGFFDSMPGLPLLKHPTQVVVGDDHACALDAFGVKCWGNNDHSQLNVPRLSNPIHLVAGFNHTCALDDEGIKCWGSNSEGQLDVPESLGRGH